MARTTPKTWTALLLTGLALTACSNSSNDSSTAGLSGGTDGATNSGAGAGSDDAADSASSADGSTDGSSPATDGEGCEALTCDGAQAGCGPVDDGCGGMLACGECPDTDVCVDAQCVPEDSLIHERVDNPFAGADFYINPDYAQAVASSVAEGPNELSAAMQAVQEQPTAVWLDRIAAIEPSDDRLGLRQHLDEALAQQMAAGPDAEMTIVIVVYDLPNRDCAAFASNGELVGDEGMQRYQAEYIDHIGAIIDADPRYQNLRIVAVIEPDSLPNAVTNQSIPACADAEPYYREGVAYAISTLSQRDNVYLYLDIAHSGWLGWDHAPSAATVYREVMEAAGGESLVSGFITNVSNYSTLDEPFDPAAEEHAELVQGYYEWNRVVDELAFVDSLRAHFPDHGFIIDTSRNGWAETGSLPLEGRSHRGNWCNVDGAGIGERPRANPLPGQHGDRIHAFFWVKPPGESDGISDPNATDPNEEGKSFDEMCGPGTVRRGDVDVPTDALDGAPHAGQWFHEQFVMLVQNANPAL